MSVEDLAGELIRFDTAAPAGSEEKCALFIRDHVREMGLDAEFELHQLAQNRANLIVRIGRGLPAGLLLSGHMDTVAAGEPSLWTVTPPWTPKVVDGRLYGRGATDMKGGLAAIVESLRSLRGKRLKRGVVLVATAGEESGCLGLRRLIADGAITGSTAAYAVVAEMSEARVVRRHKGVTRFHIHFSGRGAHSSDPSLGVNAVENASEFIAELQKYRAKLGLESDPELGSTLLPVTFAQGGVRGRFNVIPESCELVTVCRRLPRHSTAYVEEGLRGIIEELRRRKGADRYDARIEVQYEANSLDTDADSPIVTLAERLTGSGSTFSPYGTEAAFYHEVGIPSIVLGPGRLEQAHVADEFVSVDELRRAAQIYRSLLQEICC